MLRRAFARLAELRPILPLVVQPEAVLYDTRRVSWDPPVSLALRPRDLRPAGAPERRERPPSAACARGWW